jgi:hypothetical protein
MTEEEAKQKWCPMVRLLSVNDKVNFNRNYDGEIFNTTHCIASDCMMWRETRTETIKTGRFEKIKNKDTGMYESSPEYDVIKFGYCGLGGKL